MEWQKCPVCEGRGTVPHGFYSHSDVANSTYLHSCVTCLGKGILPRPTLEQLMMLHGVYEAVFKTLPKEQQDYISKCMHVAYSHEQKDGGV